MSKGRTWARCATCKKATYVCMKQGCKPSVKTIAAAIATLTADAWSADCYASWPACAEVCLRRGYTEWETEDILRSKITRWARDSYDGPDNGRVPAKALAAWLDKRGRDGVAEILDWTSRRPA